MQEAGGGEKNNSPPAGLLMLAQPGTFGPFLAQTVEVLGRGRPVIIIIFWAEPGPFIWAGPARFFLYILYIVYYIL